MSNETLNERWTSKDPKVRLMVRKELAKVLNCDECGEPVGFCCECDLNGSWFFCSSCKDKKEDA